MWPFDNKRFVEAFGIYKREIVNIRTKESTGLSEDLENYVRVQHNYGPGLPFSSSQREEKYIKHASILTERYLEKAKDIIFTNLDSIKNKELSEIKNFIIEMFNGEIETAVQRESTFANALRGNYNEREIQRKIKLNYTLKKEEFIREIELDAKKINFIRKSERQKEAKKQWKNRSWEIVRILLALFFGYLLRYFLEK